MPVIFALLWTTDGDQLAYEINLRRRNLTIFTLSPRPCWRYFRSNSLPPSTRGAPTAIYFAVSNKKNFYQILQLLQLQRHNFSKRSVWPSAYSVLFATRLENSVHILLAFSARPYGCYLYNSGVR